MARRIAFCADGTWDSAASGTNVYRISKAIVPIPGQQFSFYDDGVGSDGTAIEKLLGGAFGNGLFQKIKEGYSAIASVYEAGDEIFLFGFSRGAYTARSLGGMIAACGLPTKNPDTKLVEAAFQAYRNKNGRARILATLEAYGLVDAQITMVGVWDTVGALGIPASIGGVDPLIYSFLDTSLSPKILNAFHAVAIDERRAEFPPTVWTSAPQPGQTMKQVYFCGVHCDVGGGYADDAGTGTALSDITLSWMMCNAQKLGLALDQTMLTRYAAPLDRKYALDTVHESWSPLWLFPKVRTVAQDVTLSNSVSVRCSADGTYRPSNLSLVNGLPGSTYANDASVT